MTSRHSALLALLVAFSGQSLASRVMTAKELQKAGKAEAAGTDSNSTTPFVCPAPCQECCDYPGLLGNANKFKCILRDAPSMNMEKRRKDIFKKVQKTLKESVQSFGYTCSLPTRRGRSLHQFKTYCGYKQDQEKPLGKCSFDTHCCCNEAEDTNQGNMYTCINPLEHQWFNWCTFEPKFDCDGNWDHDPARAVDAATAVETLATDEFKASTQYTVINGRELRPRFEAGKSIQTYEQRVGQCEEGEGKWYFSKQGRRNFTEPVWTQEGCCLETEMENLLILNIAGKLDDLEYEVCKRFNVKRYCPDDQMYVEYVGKREGVCFGDESTGASLANAYGGTQEAWEAIAANARIKVKGKDKNERRTGLTRIRHECPHGFKENLGGGVRSCKCKNACGGAGQEWMWATA